ncbi:MAG: PDZ domain-containing protein [Pirellulaceae bacterium]
MSHGPPTNLRCTLVATLLVALPCAAQEPAPAESPRFKQLVEQLDADEFLARETAMLELIAAGQASIPIVQQVFRGDSLEATSRALHVLQQLGLAADIETQEAARAALVEATTNQESPVVARRAEAVLAQLIELRSVQALAELEALGAKIFHSQLFGGLVLDEMAESLLIGPEFKGTDDELRRLKWLDISRLVLVGDKVTDAWLTQAAGMTDLQELHLYQTKVTDGGMAALAEHAALRQVGIYYTPLSEAGLAHLEKLPVLNFVKLYGTKIPLAAVQQFQATTGLARVDHRKGAFLGVGCEPLDKGCVLSTVHPNTPADKAGLKKGDSLVRFGDAKVIDFESLTAKISQLDAGDVVEIVVQREIEDDRGNFTLKNVALSVTLGPWDVDLAVENGPRP